MNEWIKNYYWNDALVFSYNINPGTVQNIYHSITIYSAWLSDKLRVQHSLYNCNLLFSVSYVLFFPSISLNLNFVWFVFPFPANCFWIPVFLDTLIFIDPFIPRSHYYWIPLLGLFHSGIPLFLDPFLVDKLSLTMERNSPFYVGRGEK